MQSESSERTSTTWRFIAGLMAAGIVLALILPSVAPKGIDVHGPVGLGQLLQAAGVFLAILGGASDLWQAWVAGRTRRRERRLYREALRAKAQPPTPEGSSAGPSRSTAVG